MSEKTVNSAGPEVDEETSQSAPRCFTSRHLATFAIAALIGGLLMGYGLAPTQKDEVTKLQSQMTSLKMEADKVPSLEKKLSSADTSIKVARAEGVEAGKSSCPVTAPVAAAPAPVTACPVVAHTHAPARKVVARSAPVVRQHFDNVPSVVVPATPALTTIYVGSGGGRCDWTNPKTGQNVVAKANSKEECLQTLTAEARKQGFSSIIPANKS